MSNRPRILSYSITKKTKPALNLLSRGKYAITEPTIMGEDNQDLFRRILNDFVTQFQFDLPEILGN